MRNIIITGASRGIGFELAKKFIQHGDFVLAIARSESKLKELNQFSINNNYNYLAIDLENLDSISLINDKIKEWKQVDVLFNNAGLLIKKPFEELTAQDFQRSLQVNFLAPVFIIQSLLSKLNENSHIINIGTMGAVQGSVKLPELSAYGTSKAALLTLTELLAEELKERKITINSVALGAVQTEMLESAFPNYKAPVSAQEMANYLFDFALHSKNIYNGKILQASTSTP